MLQIKTIMRRADNAEDFDKAVNEAIAEGWALTKREVLPPCDCGSVYFHRMLYAEMEKMVVTEKERTCDNCKHCDLPSDADPCRTCEDVPNEYPTGWEPADA